MKVCLGVVLISIAVCVSCNVPPQSSKTNENEAIAESVFRYQLEQVASKNAQRYFLSLGDRKDPTDTFMRRFDGYPRPVKRYSESIYQNGRVTEKATGQSGIQLQVTSIKWVGRFEIEVEVFWLAGREDFVNQRLQVYKENGIWSVKSVKETLVP